MVNVTEIATVDRSQVVAKLGRLTDSRLKEVWGGVRLVLQPMGKDLPADLA